MVSLLDGVLNYVSLVETPSVSFNNKQWHSVYLKSDKSTVLLFDVVSHLYWIIVKFLNSFYSPKTIGRNNQFHCSSCGQPLYWSNQQIINLISSTNYHCRTYTFIVTSEPVIVTSKSEFG